MTAGIFRVLSYLLPGIHQRARQVLADEIGVEEPGTFLRAESIAFSAHALLSEEYLAKGNAKDAATFFAGQFDRHRYTAMRSSSRSGREALAPPAELFVQFEDLRLDLVQYLRT